MAATAAAIPPPAAVEVEVAAPSLSLVTTALEAHLAGAEREDEREQRRQSFEELVGLVSGKTEMKDLVASTIASDPHLQTLGPLFAGKRARDRIFKRHQRLRAYLAETVDALEQNGKLSGDQAEAARTVLRQLLRRRAAKSERSS